MDELAKRRWEKSLHPRDHKPVTALERAIDKMDELKPDHVIVIMGKIAEDGGASTTFFQAGKFNDLEQMGLLQRVLWDFNAD